MSYDAIIEAIRNLNDEDFRRLKAWLVLTENRRREAAPAVQHAIEELWEKEPDLAPTTEFDDSGQPAEWVRPVSLLRAYPADAQVMHKGKRWVNAVGGLNASEPGTSGAWREWTGRSAAPVATDTLPPDGPGVRAEEPPAAAAEWKSGTNYKTGDLVSFEGATYRVLAEHRAGMTSPPPMASHLYQAI